MEPPEVEYVVMKMPGETWGVFIINRATPEWYRHVATFRALDRAEFYASLENETLDTESCPLRDDETPAPATLPRPAPSGPPLLYRVWTPEEDEALSSMWVARVKVKEIARRLDRSVGAVLQRTAKIGLHPRSARRGQIGFAPTELTP